MELFTLNLEIVKNVFTGKKVALSIFLSVYFGYIKIKECKFYQGFDKPSPYIIFELNYPTSGSTDFFLLHNRNSLIFEHNICYLRQSKPHHLYHPLWVFIRIPKLIITSDQDPYNNCNMMKRSIESQRRKGLISFRLRC